MIMKKIVCLILVCVCPLVALADDTGEAKAYDWASALTLEGVNNFQGGLDKGFRGLANLDVTLTIDTSTAGWWENGTVFVYALGDYGKNPSELTGDVQGVSNIATDNAAKLYEFWYEHRFLNESFKVLVGLHDYNSTFYSLESAGLFTMPSFGIGPDTSQVVPSIFATTSTAVHFTVQKNNFYTLLAVYDGVPGDPNNPRGTHIQFDEGDGLFNATEMGFVEDSYKFAVGAWQKTTEEKSVVDDALIDRNQGFYLIGEKHITDDVTVFFQYGAADDAKNQLDEYTGLGVTLKNAMITDDAVGLGVGRAHNGAPFLRANTELEAAETTWELTYLRPIIEHIKVQSSIYYIDSPGMSPDVENALALGLRLYLEI
jgi:porin